MLADFENQADMKKLADFEKSGGHEKTLQILKNGFGETNEVEMS